MKKISSGIMAILLSFFLVADVLGGCAKEDSKALAKSMYFYSKAADGYFGG